MSEAVSWLFISSQTEDFSRHLVYRYFPYFDVADSRVGIVEFIVCIVTHNNVQCVTFLIHTLDELYFSTAHGTFGTHTVTASYFLVLVDEFMSEAESNADIIIMFQHFHFTAFGAGVEIDDAVNITEVHGNHVWIAFHIDYAYKASVTMKNDRFDSLSVFNDKGFHNGCFVHHKAQSTLRNHEVKNSVYSASFAVNLFLY